MNSQPYLIGILGFAIVNGIFSPLTPMAFLFHPLWYPPILPFSIPVVFFVTSLMVATLTIMIAGVPVAVFERLTRRGQTDLVAWWLWLALTALLSLPAVGRAIGFF